MDYSKLPKVELHVHLDCSLSYAVVKKINPSITLADYQSSFIAPPKCTDLADYLTRAVKGIDLMQTTNQLRMVTLDLFEQLKQDNVIYAELRFAPLEHIKLGLTPEEVVNTVNEAVSDGILETGIEASVILCTLRNYSEEQSMETIKLVETFKHTHVIGFDIAADEAGFPITNHISAFAYAKKRGISCTAHAGEAKGPDSVWETLGHLCPSRIGHGVRSVEDAKLIDHIIQNDIHLEVCPTSNIQTNVFDRIEDHVADKIYAKGVSMSINTDTRTISNVTLTSEYQLLERVFNWKKEHFFKCNLEAIKHAFTTSKTKSLLQNRLIKGYERV